MTVNKVELCGVNTAKLPLLKEEEKEELFERIKAGDEEAREKYIKGNLRLVPQAYAKGVNMSKNTADYSASLIFALSRTKLIAFSTQISFSSSAAGISSLILSASILYCSAIF